MKFLDGPTLCSWDQWVGDDLSGSQVVIYGWAQLLDLGSVRIHGRYVLSILSTCLGGVPSHGLGVGTTNG